ncbi:MAG TPA: hypothetical protein VJ553_05435 [Candidatus Paceibacterota bacterium]|nr:hypothetical protein [Candidatus Paceibacterota bacterium]
MVGDLILAYRAIKAERTKQARYRRLLGKEPDYTLLKELVDSARYEVVATVTFKDGTKVDFRRADATDRLTQLMSSDKAGSW